MTINPSLQRTLTRTFLQLIKDLKDKKEIDTFFKDFLGEKEYEELTVRLAVVYWIRKNRPNDVIKNNLGVTTGYINSIKKLIDRDGVKLAIKYMEAEEFANTWSEKFKSFKK